MRVKFHNSLKRRIIFNSCNIVYSVLQQEYKWSEDLSVRKDNYWTGQSQPFLLAEEFQYLVSSSSIDAILENKRY